MFHAHFYQPDRANPWTGQLEPEPSASPDRDWNARIHRECYRANAVARIFDEQRRVERLVNNFERLSFNVGPTLLSWMARAEPETYTRILDADWRSVVRTGHGNAIAQAYHHTILPLMNERDRRTQIRWGITDFGHRFGREPEGMWLPETAADQATIDALIDEGVRFTVLAPGQAARVRHAGGEWQDARWALDVRRPYRIAHSDGSGRSLAAWFYDGDLAHQLAFDHAAMESANMVAALRRARGHGGVVHAALDGETFGHHHAFGELGLAYVLSGAAQADGFEPTNYGAALAAHPPVDDAELVDGEGSSWSCAHGVSRWARDCGCTTDSLPGWDQQWRAPLRAALDVVRDAAAQAFADAGLLRDPWAARDAYVHVLTGAQSPLAFLQRHRARDLAVARQPEVWTLLEAQRHALAMYTSCGWFFADVAGIESVYVMRFAARALDLLEEAGAPAPRDEVLERLGEARSNEPDEGSAADVWRRHVAPQAVPAWRVAAHVALERAVSEPRGWPEGRQRDEVVEVPGHDVTVSHRRAASHSHLALATAEVQVRSRATTRERRFTTALVHLGALDFHGAVTEAEGRAAAVAALWEGFPTAPLARLLQGIDALGDADTDGGGRSFGLDAALPARRAGIIDGVFSELTERFHEQYARLYRDHRRTLEMLHDVGYELPRDLRAAAELTIAHDLEDLLAPLIADPGGDPDRFDAAYELLRRAQRFGYELDHEPVRRTLESQVLAATAEACTALQPQRAARVHGWLAHAEALGLELDLARPQEAVYAAAQEARSGRLAPEEAAIIAELGTALGLAPVAWERDGVSAVAPAPEQRAG